MLVLDDALLLATLAGVAPPELRAARRDGALATTSSWLYRLSRAIEDRSREGSLGRAFARLPADARVRVTDDLADLPESIGLLPTRALVPAMALLSVEHRLNFLTSEALAAAVLLDGAICVSTQSDLLDRAAASLHVDVRHLSPT